MKKNMITFPKLILFHYTRTMFTVHRAHILTPTNEEVQRPPGITRLLTDMEKIRLKRNKTKTSYHQKLKTSPYSKT